MVLDKDMKNDTAKELLNDYPVIIDFPVAWGEMDAFQHINNVSYIRYFESVRIKYFEVINYLNIMKETGVGPILASVECKYKAPIKYPDYIYVGCKVYKISNDRFWMKYAVASSELNIITTVGDSVLVSYDYNQNKKVSFPDVIRNKILEIEKDIEIV